MGGKSSVLQIFQAQKNFPGAASAQVASSNQVLTSMGWGVQRGGGGGEGWCQASQVSAPRGHRGKLVQEQPTFRTAHGAPASGVVGQDGSSSKTNDPPDGNGCAVAIALPQEHVAVPRHDQVAVPGTTLQPPGTSMTMRQAFSLAKNRGNVQQLAT